MTVIDLITVLGFALACFNLGYQFGRRDEKNAKK